MDHWLIWVIGVIVVVAAGLYPVVVVGNRKRRAARRNAEHAARAAIASAEVSRDACDRAVPEAGELLDRAGLMLAGSTGAAAARQATQLADRAERLWRGADD